VAIALYTTQELLNVPFVIQVVVRVGQMRVLIYILADARMYQEGYICFANVPMKDRRHSAALIMIVNEYQN